MTQAKHNPVIQRGALWLSLLMAHGIAVAAPPSKNSDGIKISGDDIKINLDCDKMDGKYRDHYNRSIHSGNNPGQGHDKQKDKNKGNGKKN